MDEVKASLDACIEAGYGLLHVDPTVDRTLPRGHSLDIDVVVGRTCELIAHAESTRARSGTQPISYEVGTEEVHGGLADEGVFERFLDGLQSGLQNCGIPDGWAFFIGAKVGTDLHTTTFDGDVARRLADRVAQLGSVIKGHYTDWVANPADYPRSGVGGANVGPEFTATELSALKDLCEMERRRLGDRVVIEGAGFEAALERAVVESERWRKWLTPEEEGSAFDELEAERREWLVATGARYVWTEPGVKSARQRLYTNVASDDFDPHTYLVDRIVASIGRYVKAFGLQDSLDVLVDGVL